MSHLAVFHLVSDFLLSNCTIFFYHRLATCPCACPVDTCYAYAIYESFINKPIANRFHIYGMPIHSTDLSILVKCICSCLISQPRASTIMHISLTPSRALRASCCRRQADFDSKYAGALYSPVLCRDYVNDIQGIKMKRQNDRLMRERDAAMLKGRLLRKQLQVAQRELETICAMLEEQKIHHKKDIAYIYSPSFLLTHVPVSL
jgi:hypothetical protein